MITPLMHILSCLDEEHNIRTPMSIVYLNENDRQLILSEGKRLAALSRNENMIGMDTSDTGLEVVSERQIVAGKSVQINPFTALLINKIRECAVSYLSALQNDERAESAIDLSTDAVILQMESSYRYAYAFVYNVMRLRGMSYDSKIEKIAEVLDIINSTNNVTAQPIEKQSIVNRLRIYSDEAYWAGLLVKEYIKYYGTVPARFNTDVLETIKHELKLFGFYGFVNPEQMYKEFSNARADRKTSSAIDQVAIDFLTQVVRSGGGRKNENNN